MLIEISTDTLRDLGLPTIVGAIAGALVTHFAARARGREEHDRTLDLLVFQDERRLAQGALDATRDLRNQLNSGGFTTPVNYGQLHNQWSDRVLAQSRLIRSDELNGRVEAAAYVIFLATLATEAYVQYAVLRGVLDVHDWLESWLRREGPPQAHLPPMDEIRQLVRVSGGRVGFDPLNDLLQERA